MLLAILPATLVLPTIGPEESTLSLLLVVDILAFISSAVRPSKDTVALHLVVDPVAIELPAVSPVVRALALDIIVLERALVRAPVGPGELALSVLLSLNVGALILGSIRPRLSTSAVLFVFLPGALVLSTVEVAVNAASMSLIIDPHAIVDVAVCVDEAAAPIGLVVLPPALVHRAIRPNLLALTLTNKCTHNPLALEFSVVFELFHGTVLEVVSQRVGSRVQVVEWTELPADLVDPPVLVVDTPFAIIHGHAKSRVAHAYVATPHDVHLLPCDHATDSRLDTLQKVQLAQVQFDVVSHFVATHGRHVDVGLGVDSRIGLAAIF